MVKENLLSCLQLGYIITAYKSLKFAVIVH